MLASSDAFWYSSHHDTLLQATLNGPLPVGSEGDRAEDTMLEREAALAYSDIAGAIVYLASDAAFMVTAQVLVIDGGMGLVSAY